MQNGALQAEGTPSIGAPGALGHVPPLLMAIKACRSEEQSKHRRSKADRGWGSARRRTAHAQPDSKANVTTSPQTAHGDCVQQPTGLLQNRNAQGRGYGVGHGIRQQRGAGGESCLLPRPGA